LFFVCFHVDSTADVACTAVTVVSSVYICDVIVHSARLFHVKNRFKLYKQHMNNAR